MKTVVNKQTKPYSQIKNSWITDTSISDTGYRLLCYIEMQSENWVFYKEEIKKRFGRGEDKYTGAMQSIKKAGYIDHYPVKNEKGSVTHRAIDLYDGPTMVGDNHTPGNPPYGNPPQYNNTNCNKTNCNNKKENTIPNGIDSKLYSDDDGSDSDEISLSLKKEGDELSPPYSARPPVAETATYGKNEINQIIQIMKDTCSEVGLIYSSGYKEREFAKHILSKKFSEDIEQFNMNLEEFVKSIIKIGTLPFAPKVNSPKDLYQNRANAINNSRKHKEQKESKKRPSYTLT